MCGIGGAIHLSAEKIDDLENRLGVMNALQQHRGPDGEGVWTHPRGQVGFAHRRLAIIDLDTGDQPMQDRAGNWITYNGEVYNYLELREEIGRKNFSTTTDTEAILEGYRKWGTDCLNHLRGMFAFALWDEKNRSLFCARDRFGIKPFYYTVVDDVFYFASEVKALLPFMKEVRTDLAGFKDYLAFQFCLAGKTLFSGVRELLPGHMLQIVNGKIKESRYWQVYYDLDFEHTPRYFENEIRSRLLDSIQIHLRSDVPVGAYISGGMDSGIVASIAAEQYGDAFVGFNGRFLYGEDYDESRYATDLANWRDFRLYIRDITSEDFINNIQKVVYYMDYPVAGPGSFPQYMVSELASQHRKVVLGGQGGDEIFGGYVRYLIAYFEQCIKAAIDGTTHSGNFIVTYESIIPNLVSLRQYKPLLKEFWREGLFEDLDRRYFRLISHTRKLNDEIDWEALHGYSPFETFQSIFRADNVPTESYFDSMTHFDFKTLLPALLHVEDRMSMAHGLESRVPFLDHPLVELAATMPSDIKFQDGTLKNVLRKSMRSVLPDSIADRKDKMGFPVPLTEWIGGEASEFVHDILSTSKAQNRDVINNKAVVERLGEEVKFGRTTWGLLCMEIWQQAFHDKHDEFKALMKTQRRKVDEGADNGRGGLRRVALGGPATEAK